jgi:hypothetical protein
LAEYQAKLHVEAVFDEQKKEKIWLFREKCLPLLPLTSIIHLN